MKRELLEQLRAEADAEREDQELAQAEAGITTAEVALSERWSTFVKLADELRAAWGKVVAAAEELDALPAGQVPMALASMPADLAKALEVALVEPGQQLDSPRLVARRVPTISTAGTTSIDTTNYARDLRALGTFR